MADVTSPGHKLGQMIGNFFEEFFADDLVAFCEQHGFYCDRRGLRPKVRGSSRKVSWTDKSGNKHDLDYVIEKNGSFDKRGIPVAFLELAWRRYTKHSRNKTGELEGSLLHLRESYDSYRFLGAILAGEYTEGGKRQLTSHGVTVLHIPFEILAGCFGSQGVNLNYPENSSAEYKRAVIKKWQALSKHRIEDVKTCLRAAITEDYSAFKKSLENSLLRKVDTVMILPLYGTESVFASVPEAMNDLTNEKFDVKEANFVKFEIQIRFTDGDRVEGAFHSKDEALHFLSMFS